MLRLALFTALTVLVGCSDIERPTPTGADAVPGGTDPIAVGDPAPSSAEAAADEPIVGDPADDARPVGDAVVPTDGVVPADEPDAAVPARDGDTPGRAQTPSPTPSPDQRRPETIRETISIEGMDEAVTLRLASFPDFRLPFSTYVRDGWTRETTSSSEGEAAIMKLGPPSAQAEVRLFVPSGNPSEAEVADMARAVAQSRGRVLDLGAARGSSAGFAFTGTQMGQVRVASHSGVAFYVVASFPPEMGDGFVPAARVSYEKWLWLDDGTGLEAGL